MMELPGPTLIQNIKRRQEAEAPGRFLGIVPYANVERPGCFNLGEACISDGSTQIRTFCESL